MNVYDNIKLLIAEGNTENAFETIINLIEENNFSANPKIEKYYDEIILLSGKYKSIEKEILLGLVSHENEQVEETKINQGLIEIINQLSTLSYDNKAIKTTVRFREEIKDIHHSRFEYDLFLCFSAKDIKEVIKLYEILVGYGLKVFISSEHFKKKTGSYFQKEIENALNQSKNFLLVWTENSSQSKWVEIEYMTFFNEFHLKQNSTNRNIYIYHEITHQNIVLPLLLRTIQTADTHKNLIKSIIEREQNKNKLILNNKNIVQTKSKPKNIEITISKKRSDEEKDQASIDVRWPVVIYIFIFCLIAGVYIIAYQLEPTNFFNQAIMLVSITLLFVFLIIFIFTFCISFIINRIK